MDTKTEPIMIGPLTGDQWASLALLDDDERNPLPKCCGDISEVRDALFDVMRAGGDTLYWRSIAEVWDVVESHLDGRDNVLANPVLRALYEAYVKDRPPVERDGEAMARMLARDPEQVRQVLEECTGPDSLWDLKTRAGQVAAVTRLGGVFVAQVLDLDERHELACELAGALGWDDAELCVVIDVLRQREGLPYEPTHPDHRGS